MTIAITNQKGGVGKTTIAGNLAVELLAMGKSVALFDADPQGSLTAWSRLGAGVLSKIVKPIDAANPAAFKAAIEKARKQYDRVLIDCPPSFADSSLAAMALADVVILPIGPSALDIMAGHAALKLAKEARQARGELKIGLAPSKMQRSRMGADLMIALAAMGETVLPAIGSRAIVAEAPVSGMSVREAGPKSAAAEEFEIFAQGVERMIAA